MSPLINIPKFLTAEERKAKIQREQARQEAKMKKLMEGGLIKVPNNKKSN